MKFDMQIEQKIKYAEHHLEQIRKITKHKTEDETSLFANIHAFFWECRSILELVAQEAYDVKGKKPDRPNFFVAYDVHLKGKVPYTDRKIDEKKNDSENSLLYYLNEYRNAISHRETPGKMIEYRIPEHTTKFKPHRFSKSTRLFDKPGVDMTWNKLLSDIFEMTIKIKDECYSFLQRT